MGSGAENGAAGFSAPGVRLAFPGRLSVSGARAAPSRPSRNAGAARGGERAAERPARRQPPEGLTRRHGCRRNALRQEAARRRVPTRSGEPGRTRLSRGRAPRPREPPAQPAAGQGCPATLSGGRGLLGGRGGHGGGGRAGLGEPAQGWAEPPQSFAGPGRWSGRVVRRGQRRRGGGRRSDGQRPEVVGAS